MRFWFRANGENMWFLPVFDEDGTFYPCVVTDSGCCYFPRTCPFLEIEDWDRDGLTIALALAGFRWRLKPGTS